MSDTTTFGFTVPNASDENWATPMTACIQEIDTLLAVAIDTDGTLLAGAVDNAAALASNVVTTAKILNANVTPAKTDLYQSAWTAVPSIGGTTNFAHGLGRDPYFVTVFFDSVNTTDRRGEIISGYGELYSAGAWHVIVVSTIADNVAVAITGDVTGGFAYMRVVAW